MKPFNLEEALAGAKVVTRSGIEVTDWHYFKSCKIYPVTAEIEGTIYSFTTSGFIFGGDPAKYSLFLEGRKPSGFINVYKTLSGETWVSKIHPTKEFAISNSGDKTPIACIDLSQFEEGHGL